MDKSVFQLNPLSPTCDCIICHKKGVVSSDEHIIPKSIGGYMHTWNVCKTCNSNFGKEIDTKLVNHYMIKWERYFHQLRGESGKPVPNPFEGTFTANDGEKYRIVEESGVLTPHIIQRVKISADGSKVEAVLDSADRDKTSDIMSKFCQRKNIIFHPGKLVSSGVQSVESPAFKFQEKVDIKKFRMGILKIAYEFTTGIIQGYVDDKNAKQIASILEKRDYARIDEVNFAGSGFEDIFPHIFGNVIDFNNKKRHYIFITNLNDQMWCFVKLFNVFCLGVKMSDCKYREADDNVIAINDFAKQDFDLFTLEELITQTQQFEGVSCKFCEPWNNKLNNILSAPGAGFYCDNKGHNLCYNYMGEIICPDTDYLMNMPDELVDTVIENGKSTTSYNIGGAFCYCLAPLNVLVPIKEILMISKITKF